MDQIDRVDRAARAQQLLNDPLLKGAFEAVEAGLVAALKQSAVGDYDLHHNITLSLQLLGQIERQFRNWIAEGQLEESRAKQSRLERIADWRKLIA
jgi:hypothetical protein